MSLQGKSAELSWRNLYGSRLGLRLAGFIFLGIVVIDILVLIPAYQIRVDSYRQSVIRIGDVASNALANMIKVDSSASTLEQAGLHLSDGNEIVGGAICSGAAGCTVHFGEHTGGVDAISGPDGDFDLENEYRILTVRSVVHNGELYRIALRLDTAWIDGAMVDYILLVAGLAACFVLALGAVTMICVGRIIIHPLARLSNSLAGAMEHPETPERHVITHHRSDEIGRLLDRYNKIVQDNATREGYRREAERQALWIARFPEEDPSPIIRLTPEGRILYANNAARGLTDALITGEARRSLLAAIELAQENFETVTLTRQVQGKVFRVLLTPIKGEDYLNIYASDITEMVQAQNELAKSKTALEDAVVRRTAELQTIQQRLTDALESMDDGFAYFGPDGKLALCNDHYRRSYEGSEQIMKVGITLEEILRYGVKHGWYPGSERDPEAWIQHRLAVRREASGQPWITRSNSGRYYRIRDYRTKDGGTVTVRVDVTDQMRQAEEFAAAKDAAEEASRAKSEFLATMSHEIRTPMNGVMGMANLLLDSELNPQQRAMTRTILESANGLLTVINDILDFSKIESGKIELESGDFRLIDSVESAVEMLQSRAREKGITLGSVIDPAMPELFKGDEGRLRQVIINLTGNGVKFTPSGSVTVEARVVGKDDTKTRVRISVHDTGPGIPEKMFDKLFADFSQLDGSRIREHEGTGLGLAISRRLIELMGGEIGVESKVGEGSTFWFEVPLLAVKGPRYGDRDAMPALNVLIHAGDVRTDEVLERQLKAWGAKPEVFGEDIQQAKDIPRNFDVAIIDAAYLSDYKKAREFAVLQAHGMAVIVLTAGDFKSADIRPDRVLLKPTRQSDLFDAMMQVFGESSGTKIEPTDDHRRKSDESIRAKAKGMPPSRILVAEDNPVNQQVIRMMLAKMGHTIDVAGNGAEAVSLARQAPYDLILMDVHMPEQDGFTATQEIRKLGGRLETVPIIALTANVEAGVEQQCFASGMTGYITKPIKVQSLADILREQLPRDENENRRERIVH